MGMAMMRTQLPKSLNYAQLYKLTGISYDKCLELVKEHKLKASFNNGELFINGASVLNYLQSLPEDHHSVETWKSQHGSAS